MSAEYAKTECASCGILLPKNEMEKVTRKVVISETRGSAVTVFGRQPTNAWIHPQKEYAVETNWYCHPCFEKLKAETAAALAYKTDRQNAKGKIFFVIFGLILLFILVHAMSN